jgi:hypothetical protein
MSPDSRKKITQMVSKLATEKRKSLCFYMYNECLSSLNNMCKTNPRQQSEFTRLDYRITSNNQKLIHNSNFQCGVYMFIYECETGYIICGTQSPEWWQ